MLLLLFSNNVAVITGTLDVTDAQDVVAFSGDFPIFAVLAVIDSPDTVAMAGFLTDRGWVAAVKQDETWTRATEQTEGWTPAVTQAETWTSA